MEIKQALKSSWSIRPFFLCRQIQTETLGIRGRGATLCDPRNKIQEERGHLSWPRRLSRSPLTYRKTRATPGMLQNGFLTRGRGGGRGVTTDKKGRPHTEERNGRKPLKMTQSEADYSHPVMAEQSPPPLPGLGQDGFYFQGLRRIEAWPCVRQTWPQHKPCEAPRTATHGGQEARAGHRAAQPLQTRWPPRPYLVGDDL